MPQDRELARIELRNRILMWHRKNGHRDTFTQDQHQNPTVDRQSRDAAPANYAKRKTFDRTSPPHLHRTHTMTSAESSPIVIPSRTSPTSPANDRNSYPAVPNPPDHPSAPIAHSRPSLSTILQDMKTNPPPYSQICNPTQPSPASAAYLQHYHQTTPPHPRNVKGTPW
jgi:hypothetical protein